MKRFLYNTKDLVLFIIAWLLIPICHIANLIINAIQQDVVRFNFRTAYGLDVWAAYNYREIWNYLLVKPNGYKAGTNEDETLSSILGQNQIDGTLTADGRDLVKLLGWIDKDHCVKARQQFLNKKI